MSKDFLESTINKSAPACARAPTSHYRRPHHHPEHINREHHHNAGHPHRLRKKNNRQPHRPERHHPQPRTQPPQRPKTKPRRQSNSHHVANTTPKERSRKEQGHTDIGSYIILNARARILGNRRERASSRNHETDGLSAVI